jgi:hypothetical protein
MATAMHQSAASNGSKEIEILTHDREAMWHSFTSATKGGIIFMIILLVGMAVFLL